MTRLSIRLGLVLALGAAGTAAAQPAPLDVRLDRLSERLSLTADQSAALDAIASRPSADGPAALWAAADEVRGVLTAAQIAQLREAPGARRGDRRPGGDAARQRPARDRRGTPRGARRAGRDAPSDAQRQASRSIRDEARAQRQSLVDRLRAGDLSDADFADQARALRQETARRLAAARPDAAGRRGDRDARREEARAARDEALGLTDDQKAQLLALRLDAIRRAPERPDLRPYLDADGRLDRAAYRAAAETQRRARRQAAQTRRQQAEGVLTADQRDLVAVHRALAVAGRAGRRGGR